MRNTTQLLIGGLLVAIGFALLLGALFNVDVGAFCFPVGLILVGLWVVFRPRMVEPGTAVHERLLGDIRRQGAWQVTDEEIWIGVGDIDLDMSGAEIPTGETRLRIFGFVCDVDLIAPENVGVSVTSTAFLTDGQVLGRKQQSFVTPLTAVTDDYATAERKIHLETTCFVSELKVRRV
jgi:lia operon protein LiaF